MTISLRADSGGTAGAVQVNGTDALLLNSNGSMTTPAVTSAAKRLRISTTGTNATVAISADELVVSNGSGLYKVLTSVNLSPSTATSGANGVDSGSAAVNTWYAVWVIWNGTTAAGLLSTSSTSPTLPSGYTFKARVGWIRTDGSASKYPYSMVQVGTSVKWSLTSTGNTPTYPTLSYGVQGNIGLYTRSFVSVSLTTCVPPTAYRVTAVGWSGSGSASTQLVASNPNNGGYGSTGVTPELVATGSATASGAGFYAQATLQLETNLLYVAADNAGCGAAITGWEDSL